jgi:hypothetical protein
MTLPKTQKGLQSKITKIRSYLSAFKREHNGYLDDSYGNRYYIFYLLFLLNDNRRSSSYIRWYEDTCPDDVGEPLQLLLWAIMLNRQGKDGSGKLGQAMLSNVYMIPAILGQEMEELDLRFHTNYEDRNYLSWFPERILDSITDEDKAWVREVYESVKFRGILDRYLELEEKLELLPRGEERSKLVIEVWKLREEFDIGGNK